MKDLEKLRLDESIICEPKDAEVPIGKCLDSFVEANAFSDNESVCFECSQGQRIRHIVARSCRATAPRSS